MYAVKQNPVLKLMGANFYTTEDIQTRNRRAYGVDMLFAHINMQIDLASESTLKSSIHRPRGKIGKGKSDQKYAPLNGCSKTKPRFEIDGGKFLQNRRYTNKCYLSLYHD